EPMTMVTDYLISAEALIFAILLFRNRNKSAFLNLWVAAFTTISVAAFLGGTYHGFAFYLQDSTSMALWIGVVYSLSLYSFLVLSATIINFTPCKFHQLFIALVGFKSLFYLYIAGQKDDFIYVIADYISAMVAVLAILSLTFDVNKKTSTVLLIAGILVSFVAAGVQQSGIILAENLNYNDLSHIISLISFWLLYRGCDIICNQTDS
ncbi:MAG: hypothetical protein AAFO95_21790, partial [Cyanobacteria bacterium J06600_6]